jgi:hypothetical protein
VYANANTYHVVMSAANVAGDRLRVGTTRLIDVRR